MRSPGFAAAGAALLFAALAAACARSSDASPKPGVAGAVQKREATRVRVRPVERREMVRRLSTTTEVESEQEVLVLPLASGLVTELRAEEGDRVEAGAVLALLDRREAEVAVEDAKVALREAEDAVEKAALAIREAEGRAEAQKLLFDAAARKYDRNVKARLVSEQELEQLQQERDTAERTWKNILLEIERAGFEHKAAQTQVERARLNLETSQVALSHTELRAPFSGVIAERSLDVGDFAGPGTPAFRLLDDRNLRAVIHRPQRELALFSAEAREDDGGAGIEIFATAEALPGRSFRGEIQRISPAIDPASGSFRVTIRLHDAEDGTRLLPGMLLRLEIVVERHPDALVVPKRALRREGDTTILFLARGTTVERVEVSEGFDDDLGVEVRPLRGAELAVGDPVIVVGNRDLEDGEEVAIVPEDESIREDAPGLEGADDAELADAEREDEVESDESDESDANDGDGAAAADGGGEADGGAR